MTTETAKPLTANNFEAHADEILESLPLAYQTELKKFRASISGPIRFSTIQNYFARMKASPATKTLAKYALKRVLKHQLLMENRLGELQNLDTLFKQIKTGKSIKRISPEDIVTEKMLRQIGRKCERRTALLCETLYKTGLRISELAGIRRRDCRATGKLVSIEIVGKGQKMRRVLLSNGLLKSVREAFGHGEYLFCNRSGSALSTRHLRRLVNQAGVLLRRPVFPHLMRHSFATNTIAKTGKIKAVSEYLGHSSPAVTLTMYVHENLTESDLGLR